jgi:hypothetical protein
MLLTASMYKLFAACGVGSGGIPDFIVPTWYKYLGEDTSSGRCVPLFTFTKPDDFIKVLLAVFEIILRIGGLAAVIFVIYGGFLYLTSGGEPEKTRNGRTTIINALIGLAITMSATGIVNLMGRTI